MPSRGLIYPDEFFPNPKCKHGVCKWVGGGGGRPSPESGCGLKLRGVL